MTKKDEGGRRKAKGIDPQMSQTNADSQEKKPLRKSAQSADALFQRVAAILDQARSNVARSVNANMVLAYWLSGREIVLVVQEGEERAEYGKRVLETLSERLEERFGRGYSVANLKNFRQFYLIYPDRIEIRYPPGSEFMALGTHALLGEGLATGVPAVMAPGDATQGFSLHLSWSHYRALMRVQDSDARDFYEREAECRAAVAASPDDIALQLKLAEALGAAQQFQEALVLCLQVVQKDFGDLWD